MSNSFSYNHNIEYQAAKCYHSRKVTIDIYHKFKIKHLLTHLALMIIQMEFHQWNFINFVSFLVESVVFLCDWWEVIIGSYNDLVPNRWQDII